MCPPTGPSAPIRPVAVSYCVRVRARDATREDPEIPAHGTARRMSMGQQRSLGLAWAVILRSFRIGVGSSSCRRITESM